MSRERHRARNVLVIAQVAMAMVLLVCAGLMIRTFQALRTVEPGFTHAEHLQTLQVSIPATLVAEPERVTRIQQEIADRLAAIPGVTSVGFATSMPMEGTDPNWNNVFVEGQTYAAGEIPPLRLFKYVSPAFFRTTGTRMAAGRELTWTEVYSLRQVAMVSENLARELWGTPARRSASVSVSPGHALVEVIGVVQDVRENGIQERAPDGLLADANGQSLWTKMRMFGARRSRSSDRAGARSYQSGGQAVWSVNSNLPVAEMRTMQEVYDQSLARTSFTLVMLAIAGGMALVIGVIGIYGVMSHRVQRRREIGIRLALGAQARELKHMFVRSGLVLAAIGVAIGLCAAAGVTRLMKSLLFGISQLDPVVYAVVPLILVTAAAMASYLPARRAAAIDPMEALKTE